MGYFNPTGDQAIDALTHGYYWQLSSDRTVDWSLSNGAFGQPWGRDAAAVIGQIFSTISYYTNIKFNYLGYFNRPTIAATAGSEINFAWAGGELFSSGRIAGLGFFPVSGGWGVYSGDSGDVFLNTGSSAAYLPYTPGSSVYALVLHEIGHVLGLKHTHDDGGTGRPTLASLGFNEFDVDWVSVMSYEDEASWNVISWDPATPMALDVIALQYLYGKNMTTGAGNDTYELYRSGFYATLWDAGGSDTVSVAAQTEGWQIALPDATPSQLVDTMVGFARPLSGTLTTLFWLAGDLENVQGSRVADWLQGNRFANFLRGNGGDDVLVGGGGTDTAIYNGPIARYQVSAGAVRDKGGIDGQDTLASVERLRFTDKTVDLTVSAASKAVPVATVKSIVELYTAFFNRVPDSEGIAFWLGQSAAGVSIPAIADAFFRAAVQYPTLTGYSTGMTTGDFVGVIYKNVLGRAAVDAEGLAYWAGALSRGSETRGTLVKSILDSAHTFKGRPDFGWVADLLDNKYVVGKRFAIDFGLSFNTPEESISKGMQIAAAVTSTDTSVAIGLIGVNSADLQLV